MDSHPNIIQTKEALIERDPVDGKKIINGFKVLHKIGEGAYGRIKLASRDGHLYAIKKFNKFLLKKKNKIYKNPDGTTRYVSYLSEVYREVQLHCQLHHPNIIQVVQVIDSDELEKLYIILEQASGGTLLNWNSKTQVFTLPPSLFVKMLLQCLHGLNYLHENLIVHRDIKPQNILIDEQGDVKICDLGCALKLESADQRIKGTEGTFQFMAPECLKENSTDKSGYLGQQADVWGLGVVMFCISELRLPFQDDNMLQLFTKIQKDIPTLTASPFSPAIQNLILQMLEKDPSKRPSVTQLIQSLEQ